MRRTTKRNKTHKRRQRGGDCGCGAGTAKPFFGGRRRRSRRQRGGDCGCGAAAAGPAKPFFGGRRRRFVDSVVKEGNVEEGKIIGGRPYLRSRIQRGGGFMDGWFDPILGRTFSANPIAGLGVSASNSASNLMYGNRTVSSNPTDQYVNHYNPHNRQVA